MSNQSEKVQLSKTRTLLFRIQSASIMAVAGFLMGAGIFSLSIQLTSAKALFIKLFVGAIFGVAGFLGGLFVSRRIAIVALAISAISAIPAIEGVVQARYLIAAHEKALSTKPRLFRDENYGVSLTIPVGWVSVKAKHPGTLLMLHAKDGSSATCNLSVTDADVQSISEYNSDYFSRVFAPNISGFELLSLQTLPVGSFESCRVRWKSVTMGVPTLSKALIVLRNGKRFMLICNVMPSREAMVEPAFEAIVKSMNFD